MLKYNMNNIITKIYFQNERKFRWEFFFLFVNDSIIY